MTATTWAQKKTICASGLISAMAMRDATDMRESGAAYPIRYNVDSVATVTPAPTLPDSAWPIGSMYKDTAGGVYAPSTCHSFINIGNVWIAFADKNYAVSGLRNTGSPLGASEANCKVFIGGDNVASYPEIDLSTGCPDDGFSASLKLILRSQCDQNGAGYFDSPFLGTDVAQIEIGPHSTIPGCYIQWKYREDNQIQSMNGANSSHQMKIAIIGAKPTIDATFLGSSPTFATATYYEASIIDDPGVLPASKNSLLRSYSRKDHPNGLYGQEDTDDRNVSGTQMDQTGCGCPQSVTSYAYPPCIGIQNRTWHEITEYRAFQPAITNGVISGNTLTSVDAPFDTSVATGSPAKYPYNASFGRYIYAASIGYRKITTVNSTSSVVFDGASAGSLSGVSVFISGYPNSIFKCWLDGVLVLNNDPTALGAGKGQRFVWEDQDAAINGGVAGMLSGNVGLGSFRFVNQMTNKDNSIPHSAGACWFSSLIITDGNTPIPMVTPALNKIPLMLR